MGWLVGWLSAGVVGLLGLHCQGPSRVGVNAASISLGELCLERFTFVGGAARLKILYDPSFDAVQ
jgi:hypothetical protein